MKSLLLLVNKFENRNNICISVLINADGSGQVLDFWDREEIKMFGFYTDMLTYLKNTSYKLDINGRCIKPLEIKEDE